MKYSAGVITISDKGARGERIDTSGPAIIKMLEESGYEIKHYKIIPDEFEIIKEELVQCADEKNINLVVTTGGTGFSPRDVTPEATLNVVERETRGIPEAMRAESLKITSRGCLSRSVAGIRKRTLIINLPGSEKAAKENLNAVLGAIDHGLAMLVSSGSAECAQKDFKKQTPSIDQWLKEAKALESSGKIGMYLLHNGTVRESAKAKVRNNEKNTKPVIGMLFSYDKENVEKAIEETKKKKGIYHVRLWLNEGKLSMGEDIMYVLIGGDIRPNVMDALDFLLSRIKNECVKETELY